MPEKTKNYEIRIPSDTSNQPQLRQALNDVDAALQLVAGGSQEETNRQLIEMNKNLAMMLDQLKQLEAAIKGVAGAIGANALTRK